MVLRIASLTSLSVIIGWQSAVLSKIGLFLNGLKNILKAASTSPVFHLMAFSKSGTDEYVLCIARIMQA